MGDEHFHAVRGPLPGLEQTHQIEQAKWDAHAAAHSDSLEVPPGNFEDYARRTSTMVGVAEFLGDLRGRAVLEYGCGLGALSVLLARSGAHVTAFDLSPASVDVARRRATANGVGDRIEFSVASGEQLPYEDAAFDVVFGKAILHHLDVHRAEPELLRVVNRDGRAAFVEPLGMNPFLTIARNWLPYRQKNPRGADQPLTYRDIHAWQRGFRDARYREIQLLSMVERMLGFNRRIEVLRRADALLLERVRFLRRYCRYVVMTMTK